MRDVRKFHPSAMRALASAFDRAAQESDPEWMLSIIAKAAIETLGDKDAAKRPGGLKTGEVDRTIAGYFLVLGDAREMLLLSELGWPPDQHRLRIAIDEGRPGWVVGNAKPLVIPNTDKDGVFTQIISSARMGSSLYAPLIAGEEVLGLITVASQARYTYDARDLELLVVAARYAAGMWMALDGPAFLARQEPGMFLPKDRAG